MFCGLLKVSFVSVVLFCLFCLASLFSLFSLFWSLHAESILFRAFLALNTKKGGEKEADKEQRDKERQEKQALWVSDATACVSALWSSALALRETQTQRVSFEQQLESDPGVCSSSVCVCLSLPGRVCVCLSVCSLLELD